MGTNSDSSIKNLACSCHRCDPFLKIWAFPLRRFCLDNCAEIELNCSKDGSNRSNSFRTEWRSSLHSLEYRKPEGQLQRIQMRSLRVVWFRWQQFRMVLCWRRLWWWAVLTGRSQVSQTIEQCTVSLRAGRTDYSLRSIVGSRIWLCFNIDEHGCTVYRG